jgi:glutamate---cysteine ligase / carboxylate-amine ligase
MRAWTSLWKTSTSSGAARVVHTTFCDEEGGITPFVEHLDVILAAVAEDADALGCQGEVKRARKIALDGTSADHQLGIMAAGSSISGADDIALHGAVDGIAAQTASQDP